MQKIPDVYLPLVMVRNSTCVRDNDMLPDNQPNLLTTFAISSSVNAFNVVVLVLPRLPTLSPNSIAASSLGASKIPTPSYLPNVQYTVNLKPNFSASLFSASTFSSILNISYSLVCKPHQHDIVLCHTY